MQENDKQTFKLRIKLKTGEEFEAEGPLDFIEKQKEAFLKIVNNAVFTKITQTQSYGQKIIPTLSSAHVLQEEGEGSGEPQKAVSFIQKGKLLTDEESAPPQTPKENPIKYSPKTDIWGAPKQPTAQIYIKDEENPAGKYRPAYFGKTPQIKNTERKRPAKQAEAPIPRPEGSVWDRIAYPDGEHIIIRRKDKSLTAAAAALIILGAAKILRNAPKMSALELSKSLKLSGYLKENERLDRILAPEIKDSRLVYEGSKRNRDYMITQSGTAKAYTAAERVLLNG